MQRRCWWSQDVGVTQAAWQNRQTGATWSREAVDPWSRRAAVGIASTFGGGREGLVDSVV